MTALALVLALVATQPRGGDVHGVVRDAVTGRPAAGARVELDEGVLVVTDREGAFRVAGLAAGTHRLRIEHDGYSLFERAVVAGEGSAPLDLALEPTALRLHEAVVVSATRLPVSPFDTARSVSVVDEVDLAREVPRTSAEALLDVAGVWVQKTNHGGGSPFVRGLSGNHVLLRVDGVRLNNATYRYGPNQYLATVDPFSLERLEVVRGVGSVAHGSDALGGVISLVSDRPAFSASGTVLSGGVDSRLMSSGQEKSGRAELQVSAPRAAVRGGFSLRNFGDLHAGGALGVRSPSGYDEQAADVKGAVRLSDRHLLTAAYQHVHQSDVPRWDQVAQRGFSLYAFDPQVRQLVYLQSQSAFAGWLSTLSAGASFHRSDETRVRQARGSTVQVTEQDVVDTRGLSLEGRTRPVAGWTFTGGGELYHDEVLSRRADRDEATGAATPRRGLYANGATAVSAAAFVSGHREAGRLGLDLGARFNHHHLQAEDASFGQVDLSPSALVGSVGAVFALAPGHRLFGSATQGFRAPNIDDVSTLGLFDFGVEVPSPALRPEKAWSYELGWKARTKRLGTVVSAYRVELRDLIDRVPDTFEGSPFREGQRVYRRSNVGRAYVEGVEADLEWAATGGLTAFGNLAYTFGQMVTAGEPLRRIPPLNGLVGLRWAGARRLILDARLRFAGRQDRLAAGDRADHRIDPNGTAGWTVFGVRAVYALRPDIRLVGALENAFDEAYRIHGSGIDGYGRHAWISAQVGF